MKALTHLSLFLLALVVAGGCASTEMVERKSTRFGKGEIAKPDRIYVYPFASVPEDVPSWAHAAGQHAPPSKLSLL